MDTKTNFSTLYKMCNDSLCKVDVLIHFAEGSLDSNALISRTYSLKALQLARRYASHETQTKAMLVLAKAYWAEGKYFESFICVDSLSMRTTRITNYEILSDIRFVMGRCDHYRGDYDKALNNYLVSLGYAERNNDTLRIGEINNTIGGIYYNQGDGKTAYVYYKKSLVIQLHKRNKFRVGRGYLNVGSALILQKKLIEARLALDSALHYYKTIHSLEGISYVYGTLPYIFTQNKQPDSSLKYLQMARKATLKINKLYALAQVDEDIARIYFEKGDFEKSMRFIDEGLDFSNKTRQNFNRLSLYLLKSQLLEKKGKFKEAFEAYKLHKDFSDSVLNASSIKKQTEDALNYEYTKKQYEQKLAFEKEELMRVEKEKQQRIIIYASFLGVFIVIVLLYVRYRSKQQANKRLSAAYTTLEQKNIIIEDKTKKLQESLSERELLLKEIHHRVKNNLQVISGLLELQKEELIEEGSKAAFDEGQSRVKSISLIHQNLYQNENLGSVRFKTFVNELIGQVKDVFESADYKMNVKTEMTDDVLDIDTAVPLGLIINELLTNSYKYATVKGKIGTIKITLHDKKNGNFELNYSDSGPGIKEGVNFDTAASLGLRLIKGLAGQLGGGTNYKNENGSVFTIWFKNSLARREENT